MIIKIYEVSGTLSYWLSHTKHIITIHINANTFMLIQINCDNAGSSSGVARLE